MHVLRAASKHILEGTSAIVLSQYSLHHIETRQIQYNTQSGTNKMKSFNSSILYFYLTLQTCINF